MQQLVQLRLDSSRKRRILGAKKKAMTARKKSQDPSISSEERKNKHGSTAPHGGTSRGKTHIGGNSQGTCTQGSTSPPATGQWSRSFPRPVHRPPASHLMEKTHPAHRACPVTGHQACPGISYRTVTVHRANGEKETSSLPISGNRPSSLQSLELDRLNSREIQESPSTGHARSPSNRPPGTRQQNITQNIASDSHSFGVEFTSKTTKYT